MKKNGKYCNGKKSMNMKPLAVLLALVLLVGCAIGGTIAWLTDETEDVTNTFTVGDINIELKEHDLIVKPDGKYDLDLNEEVDANADYKYVPGDTLPKDPFVRVKGSETLPSEAHYLFIKIKVSNNSRTAGAVTADPIVNFAVDSEWTYYGKANGDTITKADHAPAEYKDGTYYFYREQAKTSADVVHNILANKQVKISTDVTKEMYSTLSVTKPVVTFWAAAVQSANLPAATASQTAEDVAFGLITWPAET